MISSVSLYCKWLASYSQKVCRNYFLLIFLVCANIALSPRLYIEKDIKKVLTVLTGLSSYDVFYLFTYR